MDGLLRRLASPPMRLTPCFVLKTWNIRNKNTDKRKMVDFCPGREMQSKLLEDKITSMKSWLGRRSTGSDLKTWDVQGVL